MKLIVGLGNVGLEYEQTRHNVGFEVVRKFADQYGFNSMFREEKKLNCYLTEHVILGEKVILALPTVYMNNSGQSVIKIMNFYKILSDDLIVVHDDMDLPLGHIMIKQGGGAGGHHGIESVMKNVPENVFVRLRIGIGRSHAGGDQTNYVLGKFSKMEKQIIHSRMSDYLKALVCILSKTPEICMTEYNKKISNNMPMESDVS